MIEKIQIWSFKGLKDVTMLPKKMNLIIGSNGTGKTNFADFIEFLSLVLRIGLKETLDSLGGLQEVRTKSPMGRPPIMGCSITLGEDIERGIESVFYSFKLDRSNSLIVQDEELKATVYAFVPYNRNNKLELERKKIHLSFKRKKNKLIEWNVPDNKDKLEVFDDEQNLILNAYGRLMNFRRVAQYLSAMRVYNIDAQLAKNATSLSDNELERNGANLVFFLKRVLEDQNVKDKLQINIRHAVPYLGEISTERILTYTTLKFSELDSKSEFRAHQMSDGTIRLLGLLAVLSQNSPPPVVVIEEPENALHSFAIKTFIEIAKEHSLNGKYPIQIFLTSHSPIVVDAVLKIDNNIESTTGCFISKRQDGSSNISDAPPKVLKAILKNLGRPSEFMREGSFGDSPQQLLIFDK